MPYDEIATNNKLTITGKIKNDYQLSHELYGEKFYEFKIEVSRLSEAADELPVIVSERLINLEELKIDTYVEIEGQFRSYNNHNDNNSNKLKLVVFVRDIKIVEEENFKNQNNIFLNGFICKDPAYRVTPKNREICDLLIAVNRSYHKSDYIPIITWGRNARFSKNLVVGNNIKVWGRIQSREYEKKLPDGEVVIKTVYEISVSKMEFNSEK